jgi:hypothetical protein
MTSALTAFVRPRSSQLHLNTSEHSCAVLWSLAQDGDGCDAACAMMRSAIAPLLKAAEDILLQGLAL